MSKNVRKSIKRLINHAASLTIIFEQILMRIQTKIRMAYRHHIINVLQIA
jgi:hypothetical protein